MAREGLMLKDAAIKLCISVDTANKHIAAAKQALGATTLANAVYLAMLHGLIKNDDG
jgi:DNA-binding NarL/FixJ family response regulator